MEKTLNWVTPIKNKYHSQIGIETYVYVTVTLLPRMSNNFKRIAASVALILILFIILFELQSNEGNCHY